MNNVKSWEAFVNTVAKNERRLGKVSMKAGETKITAFEKFTAVVEAGMPQGKEAEVAAAIQNEWKALKAALFVSAVNASVAVINRWNWLLPVYDDENPAVSRGPVVDLEAHLDAQPEKPTEGEMESWANRAYAIIRQVNDFTPVDPIDGTKLTRKDKREGVKGNGEGPYHRKSLARVNAEREEAALRETARETEKVIETIDLFVTKTRRQRERTNKREQRNGNRNRNNRTSERY